MFMGELRRFVELLANCKKGNLPLVSSLLSALPKFRFWSFIYACNIKIIQPNMNWFGQIYWLCILYSGTRSLDPLAADVSPGAGQSTSGSNSGKDGNSAAKWTETKECFQFRTLLTVQFRSRLHKQFNVQFACNVISSIPSKIGQGIAFNCYFACNRTWNRTWNCIAHYIAGVNEPILRACAKTNLNESFYRVAQTTC
jgi:hypothetical protein